MTNRSEEEKTNITNVQHTTCTCEHKLTVRFFFFMHNTVLDILLEWMDFILVEL